jgi:Predicted aminoglycoside phosphotransferase
MRYYRFSTFTTSYYFSPEAANYPFLYGLYSPYGGKLSRWYWRKFKQSRFVRSITSVREERLPFPYVTIRELCGAEAILSFNMGSPGEAQKISMLGYIPATQQPFFAKFSQKPEAKRLSKHEIEVLTLLQETQLVPRLYDSKTEDDYVCLQTEYVQGHRPNDTLLNQQVVDYLIKLSSFHYPNASAASEMRTCLSHGDFCPWNMLVQPDGSLRMIDWEMADERVAGYDIFTWLLNVAGLVTGKIPLYHIIEKNRKHIMCYFNALQINDYTPYLREFVEQQIAILQQHNRKHMLAMYQELMEQL